MHGLAVFTLSSRCWTGWTISCQKSEKLIVKGRQEGVLHYVLQLCMDSGPQDGPFLAWWKTSSKHDVDEQGIQAELGRHVHRPAGASLEAYSHLLCPSPSIFWVADDHRLEKQVLLSVSLWQKVCRQENAALQNSYSMLCLLHASAMVRKDTNPEAFCIVKAMKTKLCKDGASHTDI